MKIMVVGGGGREHAIIKKLKENPSVTEIFALPGNGGMAQDATLVPIGAKEIEKIVDFAKENAIDYAVVAPDDPLVLGCVDALNAIGIPCFGPDAKAAIIEGSKVFSKNLMKKYGIPTAEYEVFRNNNGSWTSTKNCTIDSLLAEGDWDVITTQNSSGLSGKADGYKNLNNVADYIKEKCPHSKLIWHLIWGYQNGSKWLTPNSYNGDEKFMYESIVNCTNDIVIPSGKFDSVAPVGAAIMNARTSKLKNSVHLDDGSHLSEEFGYYIAAFTWYCHLTGQDVYDTNFAVNGMISSEELNIIVESAKNAIENPYKITQSYYTR